MSSLGSILNIARNAISANQTAVRVASHNIANAGTEGYTRQVVRMVETRPDQTTLGRLGTGVRIYDISRVRDTLLDTSYRKEAGQSAAFELRHELLSSIEEVFGEPSETGLASSLDAFYSSWSDLAQDPGNDSARRVVIQRANHVASTLNNFSTTLDGMAHAARSRLETTVQEVNRTTEQIAKINGLIVSQESGGTTASDLRDQRDRLLDSLSQLGTVRVTERETGSVAVYLENSLVVDGTMAKPIAASGEPPTVTLGSSALYPPAEGSVLGELVAALTTRIPAIQGRLDDLAEALVVQTNALQTAGVQTDGTPGTNFFDPASTSARNISVIGTAESIATSDDPAQPLNNRIAMATAAMRSKPSQNTIALGIWTPAHAELLGGLSGAEHYRATVTELAVNTNVAADSAIVHQTLAEQIETRRKSVSGVSTDEELIRVMQHQQAYTAAARLVTVVDEMMQTVLGLGR